MSSPPADVKPSTFHTLYLWGAVCLAAGALLMILFIGLPIYLAGVVLMMIFLYRAWSLLPEEEARTSPALAVGLCFVPLFNLYWFFVAFWGLAKDLNAHTAKHNIDAPRAFDTLALICCILVPLAFLPLVGLFVIAPLNLILSLVALYSIKSTAVAIAESRDANAAPAVAPSA